MENPSVSSRCNSPVLSKSRLTSHKGSSDNSSARSRHTQSAENRPSPPFSRIPRTLRFSRSLKVTTTHRLQPLISRCIHTAARADKSADPEGAFRLGSLLHERRTLLSSARPSSAILPSFRSRSEVAAGSGRLLSFQTPHRVIA